MKISMLVFCLAVIFGNILDVSCRAYSNKNVDLTKEITGENYDMDYVDVPSEKSLSRYKRATTQSPVNLIDMLGTGSNDLIKSILHSFKFITELLLGQKGCSSPTERLSIEKLAENLFQHPTQIIEIIFCFIFNNIGQETRLAATALFETMSKFLSMIFLPELHFGLNKIAELNILPEYFNNTVKAFNTFYEVLRIIKYVKC